MQSFKLIVLLCLPIFWKIERENLDKDADQTMRFGKRDFFNKLLSGRTLSILALTIVVFGIVIFSSIFVYRRSQLAGLPDIGDPFDVEVFGNLTLSNDENAFTDYRHAYAMFRPPPRYAADNIAKVFENGWNSAPDDIRRWLDDSRPILETWKRGTEKNDALFLKPNQIYYFQYPDSLPTNAIFKWLPLLEACRLESEEELNGAWIVYRAALRGSRHWGKWGGMMERSHGIGIFRTVTPRIANWASNDGIDSSLLEESLSEVISIYRMTASDAVEVKCEYIRLQAIYRHSVSETIFPINLQCFLKHEPELSLRILKHIASKRLGDIKNQEETISSQNNASRPESTDSPAALSSGALSQFIASSILAQRVCLDPRPSNATAYEEALQRALEVVLAAQLYRRRHGHLPESIEQITEVLHEFGAGPPLDPFSQKNKMIRYQIFNNRMTVWSVGSDGVDDSGDVRSNSDVPPKDIGFSVPTAMSHFQTPYGSAP